MELMTTVFLCALVALPPQALGKSARKFSSVGDLVKNKVKHEEQLYDSKSFPNFNVTSINKVSDLQSVFMNPNCKKCHNCMEQSIMAHKVHSNMNTEIKGNDVSNEIDNLENNTTRRNKRNLGVIPEIKLNKKITKKLKAKKNKSNKSVSVTKHSNEGKIYALRVKETSTPIIQDQQNNTIAPVFKCQIYRVKEYFPCESPEADLILTEKQKTNKKSVKEKKNNEVNLSIKNKETNSLVVPQFKKRHVAEEPQLPESFMPSIEEMY